MSKNTAQAPIESEFNAFSTASDVIKGIDLSGKVAIVTGGYSGLGLETVKVFRAAGATVIVPARDVNRARAQIGDIKDIVIEQMDLMNPDSIKAFAEKFLAEHKSLHILVNSAGIMACPFAKDARGNESQFATNHLGHFALTNNLWPALVNAKGARVVSVSSKGHRFSDVIFEDPNFEQRTYEPFLGYGQSKTANILFAVELDKRGKDEGIRAFAVHPGGIPDTNLGKHVSIDALKAAGVIDENGKTILDPAKDVKNIEQGAATQVWCAVHPQLAGMGGVYCEDSNIAHIRDISGNNTFSVGTASGSFGVMPYAINSDAATRLWELSEKLLAKPWGQAEKEAWLKEQIIKRSYKDDVLTKIEKLKATLDVIHYGTLSINPDRYPLYFIKSRNFDENKKTILITGGVHGYETSGVHGALAFMQNEVQNYTKYFNFICFPCISPWGYETINRWNPLAIDPNRSFRENSPAEECSNFLTAMKLQNVEVYAHFDLHETTDTDNSIFRPMLAKRDGKPMSQFSEIPDGFYLVGDSANPQPEFQKAIIDCVREVTHIAPADKDGSLIGDPLEQEGVINYDKKKLFLCGGFSNAEYITTTEVYPDSPRATDAICIEAQVAALKGGLDFLKAK